MIFFITPTSQFLLGFFYFKEVLLLEKFTSFILIWIAVFIYIRDLYDYLDLGNFSYPIYAAKNFTHQKMEMLVEDGDEIAFFPTITGG